MRYFAFVRSIFVIMVTTATNTGSMASIDNVSNFFHLLEGGKYDEAANYLAEDVQFTSPKFKFKTKEEWMKGFPTFHEKRGAVAEFSDTVEAGVNDKQFIRRGKAKVMGLSISLMEVIEVNDEGKIVSSALKKA
eukprot:CAMPEP_0194071584 /NCGR_PEP_ID=MMETSP0009_2-20130614/88784_1 /TAXON_ID=210454 /ORGANISM="Grammatophora oceanica, Strain CCMP 410" /LENGTH=133 /DNA_ID=CAMNT_0038724915 /DNA_START=885 /DNA_END=1286 /DNA_ORIENTATION=+